jgi:hypothetical protein
MNPTQQVLKYAVELVRAERQGDTLGVRRITRSAEHDDCASALVAMCGYIKWLLREAELKTPPYTPDVPTNTAHSCSRAQDDTSAPHEPAQRGSGVAATRDDEP